MTTNDEHSEDHATLHRYYLRASAIHEDMLTCAKAGDPEDAWLQGMGEEWIALYRVDRFTMRLSTFYGLVYVVCEGFKALQLTDPRLDEMFADPLFDKLRRYRNAIFHFQRGFPVEEKHMDFFGDHDAPQFMQRLWNELNRWFSVNLVRPVLKAYDGEK